MIAWKLNSSQEVRALRQLSFFDLIGASHVARKNGTISALDLLLAAL